jgi:hypothetical protein
MLRFGYKVFPPEMTQTLYAHMNKIKNKQQQQQKQSVSPKSSCIEGWASHASCVQRLDF